MILSAKLAKIYLIFIFFSNVTHYVSYCGLAIYRIEFHTIYHVSVQNIRNKKHLPLIYIVVLCCLIENKFVFEYIKLEPNHFIFINYYLPAWIRNVENVVNKKKLSKAYAFHLVSPGERVRNDRLYLFVQQNCENYYCCPKLKFDRYPDFESGKLRNKINISKIFSFFSFFFCEFGVIYSGWL